MLERHAPATPASASGSRDELVERSAAAPRRRTAVTPVSSRSSPSRACARPGHGAVSSRRSANANPTLPGWPCGGAILATRPAAADVTNRQLQRPPDRRVGAVALAERVDRRVHPGAPRVRAADDDHRPGRRGRRDQPVQRELLAARRLDRGQHDRQLGSGATGHHRVDRDLLDRRPPAVRRHHPDQLLRIARACSRASRRPARGSAGRPAGHRSARARASPRTGPRARRARARAPDPARRARPPRREPGGDLGIARARGAARPDRGQSVDLERRAGLLEQRRQTIPRQSDHPTPARRRRRAGTRPAPRRGQSARTARAPASTSGTRESDSRRACSAVCSSWTGRPAARRRRRAPAAPGRRPGSRA